MNAGLLIRSARHRAGLTQAQLAARLALKQPSIARTENGKSEPSFAFVNRALEACGYDLVTSLREHDADAVQQMKANLALTPSERVDQLARTVSFIYEFRAGFDSTGEST